MRVDGPTRRQIRETAEEVFRRGEFQQHRSWLSRARDWIARHLHLDSPVHVRGGAGGGSVLGQLLLYLLFAVVVAALVWIVYRAVRDRVRRRAPAPDDEPEARIEEERTAREWRTAAEAAEAEGRWKDAMLLRYRELVAELVDQRVAEPVPGRTTGELRRDVAERAPAAAEPFGEATLLFELPWYADAPTGPSESARFREAATRVLSDVGRST
jgi:hypothetical protein